jgi:Ca-activated chloride channel family protein
MLEWAWPLMLLVLPLPWLVASLLRAAQTRSGDALRLPYALEGLDAVTGANPVPSWRRLLALAAWCALIAAAARPQWVGEPVALSRTGRDLLLAVDASGSMSIQDMAINGRAVSRYTAIKAIAGDFIKRRAGDRIGLIVFGTQAYLLTPLTFDRDTVFKQLAESAIGLPGKETAIGDAVGLAVKRLRERPQDRRVLVLLTDGVNDAGELDPRKAIELAVAEHVKIYTIGMGADSMRVDGFFGSQMVNPSADLDEKMLTAMADKTGGRFFRARNTAELAQINTDIDRLEPSDDAKQQFRPIDEMFYWPLSVALLLALLAAAPGLPLRRGLAGVPLRESVAP